MHERETLLKQWLEESLNLDISSLKMTSGDASFRKYYRVNTPDGMCVVMDAPTEKMSLQPFVDITEMLRSADLNAPKIMSQNLESGFLLLEDFGQQHYLDHLKAESQQRLYEDAIDALIKMQSGIPSYTLPEYTGEMFEVEADLFSDWLLGRHLNIELNAAQEKVLKSTIDLLIDSALSQPTAFVHRDYHSRNLMLTEMKNPGILDYQDAVMGPVTYDLVSLLKDCYINWSDDVIDYHLTDYYNKAIEKDIFGYEVNLSRFSVWFDLMGIQRHMKAAGIFARLNYRDKKPGYLKDIPRTVDYIINTSKNHEILHPFANLLEEIKLKELLLAQSI